MSTQTDPAASGTAPPPRMNAALLGISGTIRTLSNLGVAMAKCNPAQGILMGWQSMAYLAFAAFFAWMVMSTVATDLSPGLGKFLMFGIFGFAALALVITYGSNLVTGDYMTSGISLMTGQLKWLEVFYQWSITHSGHWIAGFVLGWMMVIGADQAGAAGAPAVPGAPLPAVAFRALGFGGDAARAGRACWARSCRCGGKFCRIGRTVRGGALGRF